MTRLSSVMFTIRGINDDDVDQILRQIKSLIGDHKNHIDVRRQI